MEGRGRHSSSSSSSSPSSISTTSASSRARFFDWVRGGEAEEEAEEEEEEEEEDLVLGNLEGVAREVEADFEEEDEPEREDPGAARFFDPRLAAAKIEAVLDDMIVGGGEEGEEGKREVAVRDRTFCAE